MIILNNTLDYILPEFSSPVTLNRGLMQIKRLIFIIVLLTLSCARQKTINLLDHDYNNYPAKIIILQVPGLHENHFNTIRFKSDVSARSVNVDKMNCFGKMWSYNLVTMKADLTQGIVSQISGDPGSKNQCDKYNRQPLWSPLARFDYKSAYLENARSLYDQANECNKEFFKDVTVISSVSNSKETSENLFHFQESAKLTHAQRLIDKSCFSKNCFSSVEDNFTAVWKSMRNIKNRFIMITDYSLLNSIESGDENGFFESMRNLNEMVGKIIREIVEVEKDTLFVLSSTNSYQVSWRRDINWDKFSIKRNLTRTLSNPVWAKGAMSENFCGTFKEHDFQKRVFWRSEKIEIPFKDFFGF